MTAPAGAIATRTHVQVARQAALARAVRDILELSRRAMGTIIAIPAQSLPQFQSLSLAAHAQTSAAILVSSIAQHQVHFLKRGAWLANLIG